jgi:Cys-tRNA(Pro)/Cys-tRNA(Cys) deacylase
LRTSVDVHNQLQTLDIPHELSKLPTAARSVEQIAAQLGLEAHQIIKVIVFFADADPLAALIPGDRKVDYNKLKKVAGSSSLRLASPDEVRKLTGYLLGYTPPVAWLGDLPAYIDIQALREDVVYAGSGEAHTILKIRSYDLVRAADAEVVDIIK